MNVGIRLNLPLKAFPKDDHYNLKKDKLDVREINMGQSSTTIYLMGWADKPFNSVHFDFYLHNRKIDIYRSGLLNHYRTLHLRGIQFIDETEVVDG